MRRARWRIAAGVVLGLGVLAALGLLGVFPGVKGRYHNSDPALAVAYRAKEACSCLFVEERDEAYCRAWTEASPDVARLSIDLSRREVTARALLFWTARASDQGDGGGCVLAP